MWTRKLPAISALFLGCVSVACGDDATASATDSGATSTGDTTPTSDPGTRGDTTTSDPTTGSTSTDGTSTGGTSTGGTSTGGTDSDAGTTEPVDASTGSSTGDTTDAGTTGDTTDAGTTTTGDTTGDTGDTDTTGDTGGAICGVEGPEVDAFLVHDGQDPGCGTLEFSGQLVGGAEGPVYELDGCECNAACESPDPWTLTLDVPSPFDLPVWMPECPHIVVQRQMSKQGCELVGVSILQDGDPPGDLGVWHAGSLLGPIDAIADVWQIEALPVETCECDDCCDVPTRFDLKFSAAGDSVTIPEGGSGVIASDAAAYPIQSYQSHQSGICDDSPAIDWIINFAFIPPLTEGFTAASDMSSKP